MSTPIAEAMKALDKAKDAIETAEYNMAGELYIGCH